RALAALDAASRGAMRPQLAERRRAMSQLDARLSIAMRPALSEARSSFGTLAARLAALSPLSILARGYAIAIHAETGKALLSASEAKPGDRLDVRLHEGRLIVQVEET